MLQTFVKLLRHSISEERKKLQHPLTEQPNLIPVQRESYVGRNLALKWVEEEISRLYKLGDSDVIAGEEELSEEARRPEPKPRPTPRFRRPDTWGAT